MPAMVAPGFALDSEIVIEQAREALAGRRKGFAALLPFLGPAFIASVAYIDPGNFATDLAGGAQFAYSLVWVVVLANLMAMLVQGLSAKIGVATGKNLAELCREHYPLWVTYGLWIVSELGAMATDIAEFVGAALGFYLLLRIPLLWGAVLAAITVLLILALERRGFRRLEAAIGSFVLVVAAAYVFELFLVRPAGWDILKLGFVPALPHGAAYLAVGIVGATVMPHVVFLHSSLTQSRIVARTQTEAAAIYRYVAYDTIVALTIAGLVNVAILVMAAAVFGAHGQTVSTIDQAYRTLTPLLGTAAAVALALALLAAGLSSSAVGTLAGQVIMQGFVRFRIPIWVRRVVTMVPSFIVIGRGLDPQAVLVFTQVVLSFVLPFALVPLALMCARRDIMGNLASKPLTSAITWIVVGVILALNGILLAQSL